MRVLIVKSSSMGDIIHTLPALTDAKAKRPHIIFDWVVEEGFAEIPQWHPAVAKVIPVALRRWRKTPFKSFRSDEFRSFKTTLRKQHYDLVIDAQGLLKSAWLARLTDAPIAGYDKDSARERLASLFYSQRYAVAKEQHAVERIRQLFAQALAYDVPESAGDYGIDRHRFFGSTMVGPNVVFLHGTTRVDKHYPDVYWVALANQLNNAGYKVRLPWSNEVERLRAERIAEQAPKVEVLPRLNLNGVAGVLAQANAVVAVDTGLGHMSAALSIPTVSLYGHTLPKLIGAYGDKQSHLVAGPLQDGVASDVEPAVFAPLVPAKVLKDLSLYLPKVVTLFQENQTIQREAATG